MKLLLTGDIHIGRTSSRVPAGLEPGDARAAEAWLRLVDAAISQRVDVVCLSGDIADADNRFWEAIGPLERGVARLVKANIRTVAVAGNHDHDVLARLARQLDRTHFTLLGEAGQWERLTIERDGQPALHIDGWSFPRTHVRHSPLDSYDLPADAAVPTLGIVHGDLDDAASPYAPLDLARLQALGPQAWLLGHVHAPRLISEPRRPWVLYPGSLQALDPGEPGPHGPWIVHVAPGRIDTPEHAPMSTVCYHACDVDLAGVDTQEALEDALLRTVKRRSVQLVESCGDALKAISLRLRLVGQTPLAQQARQLAHAVTGDFDLRVGHAAVGVDKLTSDALPAIDLSEYATGHTAAGALARLLLELDKPEPGEPAAALLRHARQRIAQVDGHRDFANLPAGDASTDPRDVARDQLAHETRALLSELLSQTT